MRPNANTRASYTRVFINYAFNYRRARRYYASQTLSIYSILYSIYCIPLCMCVYTDRKMLICSRRLIIRFSSDALFFSAFSDPRFVCVNGTVVFLEGIDRTAAAAVASIANLWITVFRVLASFSMEREFSRDDVVGYILCTHADDYIICSHRIIDRQRVSIIHSFGVCLIPFRYCDFQGLLYQVEIEAIFTNKLVLYSMLSTDA